MGNRRLKPQVKAILIIIFVILAAIVLENLIRLVINVTEDVKTNKEVKKEQEEYMATPEYIEDQYVEACVKQTMEYLNAGDYESLYNVLDPDYKEYMKIDSVENFKNVLGEYTNGADSIKLLDYGNRYGRYVCNVLIEKEGTSSVKKLLVTPFENDTDFYIILDDIYSIEKYTDRFRFIDVEIDYNLVYKIDKGTTRIFVMDITNRTNKDMVGSYAGTYLTKTNRLSYSLKNKEELTNVTIPAGETVRINFEIDTTGENSYVFEDNLMYLNFEAKDNTRRKDIMILHKEYYE